MTLPRSEHCYASTADFRGYLSGADRAGTWNGDEVALLRILAAVSLRMEQAVQRVWGPRQGTREYDIHRSHREPHIPEYLSYGGPPNFDPAFPPDYWPQRTHRELLLHDWLLTADTVMAYADTAHSTNVILTAGTGHDYLLLPYASLPATRLALLSTSLSALSVGQQTLTITGTWGWLTDLDPFTTLVAGLTPTDTVINVGLTDAPLLSAGQTLQIEDEQLAVRVQRNGSTLFLRRGVNGTVAATHAIDTPVSLLVYPDDVTQACIEIAKARFRSRDAGQTQVIGDPSMGITLPRPGIEEEAILKALKRSYDGRALAGTRF